MREFLLPEMIRNTKDKISNIIERGTDFMAISTTNLIFLDMVGFHNIHMPICDCFIYSIIIIIIIIIIGLFDLFYW